MSDSSLPHTTSLQAPDPVEALLEHSDWLHRLAARLASTDAGADDLSQRTWLAALRDPPAAGGGSVRGWLARVLRNEARMAHRGGQRRRDREGLVRAEAPHSAPSTDEVAAESEQRFLLQRRLLAAVEELREPYRTAVMLRYFEDLSVANIAARTSAPPKTVETRLRRGREMLRLRLDEDHGSRAAWAALAAPAARHLAPASTAAPITLASIMTAKTLLLSTCVLVVAGIGLRLALDRPTALEPVDGIVAAAPESGEKTVDSVLNVTPLADERVAAAGPQAAVPAAPEASEAAAVAVKKIGHVYDGHGKPRAQFPLRLSPAVDEVETLTSNREGAFTVRVPSTFKTSAKVAPLEPGFTVLFARSVMPIGSWSELPPLLAAARSRPFTGTVTDLEGAPIPGATCTLALPSNFRSRFNDLLLQVDLNEWSSVTGSQGQITLPEVPSLAGCELTVLADGFEPRTWSSLGTDDGHPDSGPMLLELTPINENLVVQGIVVNAAGEPIESAYVGYGTAYVKTQADGRFEFALDPNPRKRRGPQRLIATAAGFMTVTIEPARSGGQDGSLKGPAWPDWNELRLTEETKSITGTVVDPGGEPKPGAVVWIEDPTVIGTLDYSTPVAEHLGGDQRWLWQKFTADEEGRFEVPRLGDRSYQLRAMVPATMHLSEDVKTPAGARDVVLQLDRAVPMTELGGRILNQLGEPVPGVKVCLTRTVLWLAVEGGSSAQHESTESPEVLTSADGSFSLGVVPLHERTKLRCVKEGFTMLERALVDLDLSGGSVDVTMYANCQVRIVDSSPETERATGYCLKDRVGEKLRLTFVSSSSGIRMMTGGRLAGGASSAFQVSGAAVTVEFTRHGELVESREISLTPGELNEIQR